MIDREKLLAMMDTHYKLGVIGTILNFAAEAATECDHPLARKLAGTLSIMSETYTDSVREIAKRDFDSLKEEME